jgi:histidine triad (HIT) family protein
MIVAELLGLNDCVFCDIIQGRGPARVVREWGDVIAIVPLRPVVEGHTLVIPKRHVADAATDPDVSAATMRRAAEIVPWPANIITSLGADATQSVFHLHLHIVPRALDDGLALPWYSGKRSRSTRSATGSQSAAQSKAE